MPTYQTPRTIPASRERIWYHSIMWLFLQQIETIATPELHHQKRSNKNENANEKEKKGKEGLIPNHPKQEPFKITINNSVKPPNKSTLNFFL